MKIKRLVIPLAAIALASLLFPTSARQAYACSCGGPGSRVDSALSADAIVIATVTGIIFTPSLEEAPGPVPDRRTDVVVQVQEWLKGQGPVTIQLHAPRLVVVSQDVVQGDSCEIFGLRSVGRSYLLILTRQDGTFRAPGLCSGSGLVDFDPYFLQEIRDALARRFPSTGSEPPASGLAPYHVWLPIFMGVALLGTSVCLLRRGPAGPD